MEDTGLLTSTISRILDENPGPLSELLGGKEKVMGFFVGQIMMKEMKGKANPASVREALLAEVERENKRCLCFGCNEIMQWHGFAPGLISVLGLTLRKKYIQ